MISVFDSVWCAPYGPVYLDTRMPDHIYVSCEVLYVMCECGSFFFWPPTVFNFIPFRSSRRGQGRWFIWDDNERTEEKRSGIFNISYSFKQMVIRVLWCIQMMPVGGRGEAVGHLSGLNAEVELCSMESNNDVNPCCWFFKRDIRPFRKSFMPLSNGKHGLDMMGRRRVWMGTVSYLFCLWKE